MLLPVYGVRAGVGEPTALMWLTVVILGAIALQFPLGWLADRFPYRRMLLVSAVAGTLLPVGMYLTLSHPWMVWAVMFLLGGVVLGYYTIGLAQLGAHFRPGELAIANAGFMVMYEGGTTAGPIAVGAAMEIWRPHGFLAALTAFALGFLVMLLRGTRTVRRA
jgi:MFS family permease